MASFAVLQMGLQLMSWSYTHLPKFRKEIWSPTRGDSFTSRIQMTTRERDANIFIQFADGKMKVKKGTIDHPDMTLIYRNTDMLAQSINTPPDKTLDLILTGDLCFIGNLAHLAKFSYLSSIFPPKKSQPESPSFPPPTPITEKVAQFKPTQQLVLNRKVDEVQYLPDPYLGRYTIEDFPHLKHLKNRWFAEHPWVCPERAQNITTFFRSEGFDTDRTQHPWHPGIRQGKMLEYLLSHKTPHVFEDDLLPGSTTSYRMGVQLFPEFGALNLWPELHTVHGRELNPYHISPEAIHILNEDVFPYFINRNIREQSRKKYNNPICQQLEEYFVLYFMWKTQAISHTIPNFPRILQQGLEGHLREVAEKLIEHPDPPQRLFYESMQFALQGVVNYATNLKLELDRQIHMYQDQNPPIIEEAKVQLEELRLMRDCLSRVPFGPAKTFRDALTAVWILWVCLHQENMNAGLSLGRLDQVFYPYFLYDMQEASSESDREQRVKKIIELIGAFYLKCQDHLPCVPNVGNKLFGGSSSDQVITLGGITPEGENAVNDLTYIFLKVTELITLRDPNVNARYDPQKNSAEYLKRLCEVNINTTATPSIHNDGVMIPTLVNQQFQIQDARNWAATGCVEPTIAGCHMGHTNCMMFNVVAPLETVMNNGYHPLLPSKIGLETGIFTQTTFPTFESLLNAYKQQSGYFIAQSIEYNNNLGIIHQEQHPTPLLSSLIDGTLESGRDIVNGGAKYNSSGVALVALVDVIDSLYVIQRLVYEDKVISLDDLKIAIDRDFTGPNEPALLAQIKQIPKFGSNYPATNQLAHDLLDFMYTEFRKTKNYRGGNYFIGLWSMSNHVAFGILSGTLPSGRLRGKAFTPGITPAPGSSPALLENIKSVAALDFQKTPNNIAFNVKLVPSPHDPHSMAVDQFYGYSKAYFDLGGLQLQFNVVTTQTLRDAMVHPDNYRWLMVRISGYNAYFVQLNRDMQIELIERMEFHT